jgi:hypothetical protein
MVGRFPRALSAITGSNLCPNAPYIPWWWHFLQQTGTHFPECSNKVPGEVVP